MARARRRRSQSRVCELLARLGVLEEGGGEMRALFPVSVCCVRPSVSSVLRRRREWDADTKELMPGAGRCRGSILRGWWRVGGWRLWMG